MFGWYWMQIFHLLQIFIHAFCFFGVFFFSSAHLCSLMWMQPLISCSAIQELMFPNCCITTQRSLTQMFLQRRRYWWPCFYDWLLLCEVNNRHEHHSVLYCITHSKVLVWLYRTVLLVLSSFHFQGLFQLLPETDVALMYKCFGEVMCFLLCSSTGGKRHLLIYDAWWDPR